MKTSKFKSLAEYRASLTAKQSKKKITKEHNAAELLGIAAATRAINYALSKLKRKS